MKYIKILILLFFAIDLHSQIDSAFIINKYSDVARKIYHAAMKDSSSWERLAYMCDTYGPRLSGSENLEKAMKWIHEEMQRDGLVNVKSEKVMVNVREDGIKKEISMEELEKEIRDKCKDMPYRPLPIPKLLSQRPIFFG